MATSMEAYMKAVDQQMGSGAKQAWQKHIDSDASTSCSRLSAGSGPVGSDSSLASKRTALTRTPLSAQSKPFVSRVGLTSQATPFVSTCRWVPMAVYQPVPQAYSEEAQEDIYLALQGEAETLAPTPYSETLQQDVYLGNAEHKTLHSRGRLPWREARCVSRTPSPASASVILSEVAEDLAIRRNEGVPVKHTFIHYDLSEAGDARSEACSQGMKRSVSAPCVLLRDTFQIVVIESMPELHLRGECSPCAYFYHKQDGCRWGAECSFCHECPASEIKKRKKMKFKAMRDRKMMELDVASKHQMMDLDVASKNQKWCDLDLQEYFE